VKRPSKGDVLGPLVVAAIFIGLWYLLAYRLHNNFNDNGTVNFVPPPHKLFMGVGPALPAMLRATWLTTRTALLGLGSAMVLGTALAIVMNQARWMERSLWPFLVALQAIPILAVVPLLASVFRNSSTPPRLITVILVALFPIVSNTLFGLHSVDQPHHDLFNLHRAGRWTRLVKLELPAASPAIFTGFRISAGLAVIGSIVADFFFTRGDPGLGRLIQQYFFDNQPPRMFVASILAAVVGITFFLVFGWIGRRVVGPWLPGAFGAR
jgi:NitT/TauT family transport system permease protein